MLVGRGIVEADFEKNPPFWNLVTTHFVVSLCSFCSAGQDQRASKLYSMFKVKAFWSAAASRGWMTSKMTVTVISRDNTTLMSVKEFWQFKWNRCARFTGHLSNRRGAFDNWIKRSRRSTYYARMVLTSSIELQGPGLLLKDLKGTVTLYRRFQNFASCDSSHFQIIILFIYLLEWL